VMILYALMPDLKMERQQLAGPCRQAGGAPFSCTVVSGTLMDA